MLTAFLTIALLMLVITRWVKKDGALKSRISASLFCGTAVAFVWFLNYWNLLGWNY